MEISGKTIPHSLYKREQNRSVIRIQSEVKRLEDENNPQYLEILENKNPLHSENIS